MRWRSPICAAFVLLTSLTPVAAQAPVDAQWIWFDEGDPATEAPAGKVWFRREVRATEPSTGAVRVACDESFVLWVNGQRVGAGEGQTVYRFNLNGIVERGPNVVAVEAANLAGKAGLLVDGEVRGQGGGSIPFDSNAAWSATRMQPEGENWLKAGFDTSDWKPAKELGLHDASPWKALVFGENYLDRYQLAPGFKIERIGEPELVGSLVAITWGNRGRLFGSPEGGPVNSLIDENGDGVFDKAVEYCGEVKNCQGLCQVGDDLYVVGNGPQGTGMYRLPDRDHNDQADEVQLVTAYKGGMGEHGPHDVVLGPDGWLYHNLGNHAWIEHAPEPTSPIRSYYEGDLLRPRFEDPNGHAAGIPAPGGTVWRFTPDGKQWWLHTHGFRNHYDIGFNSAGELFTFDSDMEWEVGMPFYKPVRVAHCTPGADFGWRSNAGKWPEYYMDALPSAADIGRGSPTGVVFYEHNQFPESFAGAYLVCDWSMGRIISVKLQNEGATYRGEWETLVSGNPLNVSDIEVDRDGSVIFSTGGRRTEGGLYRVSYAKGAPPAPAAAKNIEQLLALPQSQSAWAREIAAQVKAERGDRWSPEMTAKARAGTSEEKVRALSLLSQLGPRPDGELLIALTQDKASPVRAFAAWLLGDHPEPRVAKALAGLLADGDARVCRRACESFVRSGLEPPVEPLVALLASPDRFLRFAARLALERAPAEKWRELVLKSDNPQVTTHGLLALHRQGPESLTPEAALERELALWEECSRIVPAAVRVDLLRAIELTLLAGANGANADKLAEQLLASFPVAQGAAGDSADDTALDMELSRLLCYMQSPGAAAKIVAALEQTESQALQIHYALVSSYLKAGWTYDLRRRMFAWYDKTQSWEGGHSFPRWLENIMSAHLAQFSPQDRRQLLEGWSEMPFATRLVLRQSEPAAIDDYEGTVSRLMADLDSAAGRTGAEEMVAVLVESLAKTNAPASQAALRKLFDEVPDRREQIARGMAQHPVAENWPYLVRSLEFGDSTTLQLCIAALRGLEQQPEKPEQTRAAILAGLKLGEQGGLAAVELLERWTKSAHGKGLNAADALVHYQAWYRKAYPEAPAPELPQSDAQKTRYTYQQLFDLLEKSPEGRQGDAQRGEQVFAKANCLKCHRFLNKGEGVGPDLTAVRRRFQRKEIIESLVYPSQVVSDQYRSVTLTTVDGQIYTGMPTATQEGAKKVVLLLQDATRLEIAKDKIDEMQPSKTSVMPEGALKDLSPQEIADLFAFLETSKNNAIAAAPAADK